MHTPFSNPGRDTARLAQVSADLEGLSAVSRNLVVHYLSYGRNITEETAADINSRWVTDILAKDRSRHRRKPYAAPRKANEAVRGCCRDHCLLAVSILRSNGVPARIRYGYADYLVRGFSVDHTIVEVWNEDERRWIRFDPEVPAPTKVLAEPFDQMAGPHAPFKTAAEVWQGWRGRTLNPNDYGVRPGGPERGPWMIQTAVIRDAAFRAQAEPLLWDTWGAMSEADGPTDEQIALADRVAAMTVAADGGDVAKEAQLIKMLERDPRVALPSVVLTRTPGRPAHETNLRRPLIKPVIIGP